MNILELVFSPAWGGLEILVSVLASRFKQQGHKVTCVIAPNLKLQKTLNKDDINYSIIKPFFRYADIITAWRIKKFLLGIDIDIIHVYQSKDLSTAIILKKLLKSGKVVFTQQMDSRHDKFDFFHKWIYKNLDQVVCATKDMMKNHTEHTPVSQDKISVIYNGTDLNRFNNKINFYKKSFLRKAQIPESRLIIGTIGRLDRLKNQSLLINAAIELIKKHKDKIHFILVGDETDSVTGWNYKTELIEKIRNNNLQNYISIFDFSDEIEKYFSLIDIFVLTTPKESFGFVLTEAMAMGKPVIASNRGGPKEIIENELNGFLFEPDNVEDLSVKLSKLILDDNLRGIMGKKSLEIVRSKFDLSQKVYEYLNLFESIK